MGIGCNWNISESVGWLTHGDRDGATLPVQGPRLPWCSGFATTRRCLAKGRAVHEHPRPHG